MSNHACAPLIVENGYVLDADDFGRYLITGEGPGGEVSFEVRALSEHDAMKRARKMSALSGMRAEAIQ